MVVYSNLDNGSRISGFEISDNSICVWFKGRNTPKIFSCPEVEKHKIETMKKMAESGHGLHRYIKRNVEQ